MMPTPDGQSPPAHWRWILAPPGGCPPDQTGAVALGLAQGCRTAAPSPALSPASDTAPPASVPSLLTPASSLAPCQRWRYTNRHSCQWLCCSTQQMCAGLIVGASAGWSASKSQVDDQQACRHQLKLTPPSAFYIMLSYTMRIYIMLSYVCCTYRSSACFGLVLCILEAGIPEPVSDLQLGSCSHSKHIYTDIPRLTIQYCITQPPV